MSKIVITIPKNGSIEDVKTALKAINQKDVIVKITECSITLDVEQLPKEEIIDATEIIVVLLPTSANNKLEMTKETKELFGIGLKEAKDFVDKYYNFTENDDLMSLNGFVEKLKSAGINATNETVVKNFSEYEKTPKFYEIRLIETVTKQ